MIGKYIVPFSELSFNLLGMLSFDVQTFLILMKLDLSSFNLIADAVGITCKKPLSDPRSLRFAPVFLAKCFIVFALTLRSLIHFDLICICSVMQGSHFILLHVDGYPVVSAQFVEKTLLSQ